MKKMPLDYTTAVAKARSILAASALAALVFIAILIAIPTTAPAPLMAAEKNAAQTVTVSVGELTAPFLAYGLEKKLRALDGVTSVRLNTMRGTVEVVYKKGASFDKDKLKETVKAAGFKTKRIKVKR